MASLKIDMAIDDYLHTIVRTRPWTKAREEELLVAFSDWLYEQPAATIMLTDIATEHVKQYATAAVLSESTQHELCNVLNNVYRWSAKQGWIARNPFGMAAAS